MLLFPHREELHACRPDEHELCHMGPSDDECSSSLQLVGPHEPPIGSSITHCSSVPVRNMSGAETQNPLPESRHTKGWCFPLIFSETLSTIKTHMFG